MIETMSLNEATEYLRQHGMRITNATLAAGIASKFVPKLAKLYHVTDEEIIAAIRAAQEARAGESA